jgi:maleate isomerase
LAVPYKGDLTREIAKVYGQHGFEIPSESHLDQTVNTDIGSNPRERIRQLLRDSVSKGVEAIAVVCTNLAGTPLVDEMERELGIPIIDSIAVTFWQACRLAGVKAQMKGWGALMDGSLEK